MSPTDGILSKIFMTILYYLGWPLNILHDFLRNRFKYCFIVAKIIKWNRDDLEGLFIELWIFLWAIITIFVLLPLIAINNSIIICLLLLIIVIMRGSDSLYQFLGKNFELTRNPQRNLARSYILLLFVFIELAAIFSILQICVLKFLCCYGNIDSWINILYNTILNMVTIGGQELDSCSSISLQLLRLLRIAQPIFSILLIALAINQSINYNDNK
ncbi:MAG: hypothetical protein ACFFG0_27010 [Candidatus Thorarchaeota archaeon]